MQRNIALWILIIAALSCMWSCNKTEQKVVSDVKGKLFIIGGGKRPVEMLKTLTSEAKLTANDYIVLMPMASAEPDSQFVTYSKQFAGIGFPNVKYFNFERNKSARSTQLDSVRNAKLIYITGGNQNQFMAVVKRTPIEAAMKEAYKNGAVIAGTSAGAAVMSEKMITGNEIKHKDYNETFRSIEAQNIEIDTGLGFITTAIIDQHFIKRSRYNRLISSAIEYPHLKMIGIDEATAILVKGDTATVVGNNQVIVIENTGNSRQEYKGLLGAKQMKLEVYLPGEKFLIAPEKK